MRPNGIASAFDHLGDCNVCCAHCEGALITTFSGFGPPSHHNLIPFQGPGIAPLNQTDSRWGLFALAPYGGFHNTHLSPTPSPGATGYLRHDCFDCAPPTHWIDVTNGFVDEDGTLLALPAVLDVSPNVLTIALIVGCPNEEGTAVNFPFMGARPWF